MNDNKEKLISKLKEMFQFGDSDLDFGIYRVLNCKRNEIENFIEKELPKQIENEVSQIRGNLNSAELQKIDTQIASLIDMGIGGDAIAELQNKRKSLLNIDFDNIESSVYNHLLNFFSRYYVDGDFISQRRYKDGVYSIPYEGEEVKLHWANADQFYIKTSEYFKDYSFTTQYNQLVTFKLIDAQIENNNNKSVKPKRFQLCEEEPFLIKDNALYIRLQYKEGDQKQESYIADIIREFNKFSKNCDLIWTKLIEVNANKTCLLEKHLKKYTAKNTFDYFIHKDLSKFLNRELDFYIKNEVFNIDNIDASNDDNLKQIMSKIKIIKRIAQQLIKFLAQIENFQKNLYLKKKFVYETNYFITLDRVPEQMYPSIISNKNQLDEWQKLFKIDLIKDTNDSINIDFLKNNPFLVLDTKFFDNEFKEKLVESIDQFDDNCDGLLIHSENFQAINFLRNKYSNKVDCIYIDPPYNTNSSPILYKNNYKDSSWLSLMNDRLIYSRLLLSNRGLLCQAIDDIELRYLTAMTDSVYNKDNYVATITVLCTPQGRVDNKANKTTEYTLIHAKDIECIDKLYVDKLVENAKDSNFRRSGMNASREERPKRYYPLLVNKDNKVEMITDEEYSQIFDDNTRQFNEKFLQSLNEKYQNMGYKVIYPDSNGNKNVWQREFSRAKVECDTYYYRDNNIYTPAFEQEIPKTLWNKNIYSNATYGTKLLNNIICSEDYDASKNTPKSPYAVKDFINLNCSDIVLDFFAGSGTTAHAVMLLNKELQTHKKYILCEMGDYFDTVLKPRIAKNIYSSDWKDGDPIDRDGFSQCIKYIRLESYEDTLNNLVFSSPAIKMEEFAEEYLLNYALDFETRDSDCLLNLDKFNAPFDYKLRITQKDQSSIKTIDLVETFNFLLGININKTYATLKFGATFDSLEDGTIQANLISGNDFKFKAIEGSIGDNKVLIVWRNLTSDCKKDDAVLAMYMRRFANQNFDDIYINGDNNLRFDNKYQVHLIEEVMKKLMFENL